MPPNAFFEYHAEQKIKNYEYECYKTKLKKIIAIHAVINHLPEMQGRQKEMESVLFSSSLWKMIWFRSMNLRKILANLLFGNDETFRSTPHCIRDTLAVF
jgi:hypothetical protein